MLDLEINIREEREHQDAIICTTLSTACLTIPTTVKVSFQSCMLLFVATQHVDVSQVIGKVSSHVCACEAAKRIIHVACHCSTDFHYLIFPCIINLQLSIKWLVARQYQQNFVTQKILQGYTAE